MLFIVKVKDSYIFLFKILLNFTCWTKVRQRTNWCCWERNEFEPMIFGMLEQVV